jgi:hypothetical protein
VHSDSEYSNRAKNTIQGQFSVPKDKLSKRAPHVLWRDTPPRTSVARALTRSHAFACTIV